MNTDETRIKTAGYSRRVVLRGFFPLPLSFIRVSSVFIRGFAFGGEAEGAVAPGHRRQAAVGADLVHRADAVLQIRLLLAQRPRLVVRRRVLTGHEQPAA